VSDELQRIFEAEYVYVCRSLRRLGVREADVPDVAQELFLLVHRELARYDRQRPLRPWLYAFVVRLAANHRKLRRHAYERGDEGLASAPAGSDDAATRDLVLRALATLDDDKRTVLVLFDLEGFDAKEIAAITGAPVNTVYSRLRLAREAFRAAVGGGAP
jgi:RNA polymerase sigma-70 factor, ECF subfamily